MMQATFKTNKNSDRITGFTLIELLVVVSVIAVLLAILLPTLGKAKALAWRSSCGSNLKQLALAWIAYLDDNDGRFYQGIRANYDYGGWKGIKGWWPRPLNEHVGLKDPNNVTKDSAKVYCCPADRGGIPGALLREKAYHAHGTSYQTNIFLIGQNRCGIFSDRTATLDAEISKRLNSLNVSDVANHSRLLLIGDCGWINQWMPEMYLSEVEKKLAEWHGKTDYYNLAFLDGHTEFLNIRKGFYVTPKYCVLPFEDLYELALKVQGPPE